MSDVIKFEFNVPVEVALRFTALKVFPSPISSKATIATCTRRQTAA